MILSVLVLAGAVDGAAALRHASHLAALGPHPWGSPRNAFAAEYVSAQFRDAGLAQVRLQEFESHGIRGANVLGVLPAASPDFILVGAHHDTAPGAPGAYDDGGGVGILIETARTLASEEARTRTVVFASFDGEEAWATGKTTTAGSRAYLESLGANVRNLVAAFIIEMCGYKKGTPTLHTIAYDLPLQPGRVAVAPAWLVSTALSGARSSGSPFAVGDPLLSWLYQPAVRTVRADFYGDDLSFLQAGLPAVFASDSSFSFFYPWYHQSTDTADRLDAEALARMGRAVQGAVGALLDTRRGRPSDPDWFAAFGVVVPAPALFLVAGLCVLPGLLAARRAGTLPTLARGTHALIFGFLVFRNPVPVLFTFLLPNLVPRIALPMARRAGVTLLALLPAIALGSVCVLASLRGFAAGLLLGPLEMGLALLALLLLLVGRAGPPPPRFRKIARPRRGDGSS